MPATERALVAFVMLLALAGIVLCLSGCHGNEGINDWMYAVRNDDIHPSGVGK